MNTAVKRIMENINEYLNNDNINPDYWRNLNGMVRLAVQLNLITIEEEALLHKQITNAVKMR